MVSPLALTERQLLIYRVLYSKCNFDNMIIDITVDQIISNIKIVDLSYKVVYSDMQKLLKMGFLELVKKASKGNPPVYKIVNYSEIIGKPKENQRETKRKLKYSNSNSLNSEQENQKKIKRKPKGYTIKEKEKEINIYSRVITRLNEISNKNYKHTTKKTIACIDARINEGFTENDFYKVIEIKAKEWLGTNMEMYLRPETLFGNKFEGYLNQNQHIMEQPKAQFGKPSIDYSQMTPEQIMALGRGEHID